MGVVCKVRELEVVDTRDGGHESEQREDNQGQEWERARFIQAGAHRPRAHRSEPEVASDSRARASFREIQGTPGVTARMPWRGRAW